jgi:hypothetical protein
VQCVIVLFVRCHIFISLLSSKLTDMWCVYTCMSCVSYFVCLEYRCHTELKTDFLMAAVLVCDLQKNLSRQKLHIFPITIDVGGPTVCVCVCMRARACVQSNVKLQPCLHS